MDGATVPVLVMAPHLGADLSYVSDVDPRVEVLDGNAAMRGELVDQGLLAGPVLRGTPDRHGRDRLLGRAEVLLVGFPVPPALVERMPALRWVHHTQAGVSNLLRSDLWAAPVALTSSRGAVAVGAIAEYVMAGVFHFARGLDEAARRPRGAQPDRSGYRMRSVSGSTLGIVGLGGIGREVARLARAVGMRVVATRRSVTHPVTDADGVDLLLPAAGLPDLAAQSDVLVVCSQLTPETRSMIGPAVFDAMKDGAVLINVARGEEVDEDALLAAIGSGRLQGALLDVYDGESDGRPPRPELLAAPGILLTPHNSTAGDAVGAEPVRRLFADNLRRYLAGHPLLNLVDRGRGY